MCTLIISLCLCLAPPIHIIFRVHLTSLTINTITTTSRQDRKNDNELIVLQTFPPPSVAVISRENWALVSLSSFRRVERVPLLTKRKNVHHQLITKMTVSLVGISSQRTHVSLKCALPSFVRKLRPVAFEPLKQFALLKWYSVI